MTETKVKVEEKITQFQNEAQKHYQEFLENLSNLRIENAKKNEQGYYENSVAALSLTRKYLSSAKGLPYLVKYHIGIDNTYKEMQKVRKLISTKTTVNDAKKTLKELNLIK